MRKACAQTVDSVFTFTDSDHTYLVFDKFIPTLYRLACTTFSTINTVFAHMISTNSTGLITITTFYKKDLLITHRGIN